jgi:hypothetical protein
MPKNADLKAQIRALMVDRAIPYAEARRRLLATQQPPQPRPGIGDVIRFDGEFGCGEFTAHPAAQPTITCAACGEGMLVLVLVEAVPALQWIYACTACGTQHTAARRDPYDAPSFAYFMVMAWSIDRQPPAEEREYGRSVSDAYLHECGQPLDLLAALPVHEHGGLDSWPLYQPVAPGDEVHMRSVVGHEAPTAACDSSITTDLSGYSEQITCPDCRAVYARLQPDDEWEDQDV